MDAMMEREVALAYKVGAVDFRRRPALKSKTGSWKAVPFILVLEVCEVASFATLATNIVTYLLQQGHFTYSDAAVLTTNFLGTSFFVPIIAGFFADAYLGRFPSILLFGMVEVLGLVLMTLTATVPSLKEAPACAAPAAGCRHVEGKAYGSLMAGMYLVAIGSGGVRVNLSSHGADQFDEAEARERIGRSSFFNWFFFCLALGFGIAATFLVYIQEFVSFGLGFGVAAAALFLGLSVVAAGVPFYRFELPVGSPLTRIAQVLVAAFRKRHSHLPSSPMDLYEVYDQPDDLLHMPPRIPHTDEFRFLDKAAVMDSNKSYLDQKPSPWMLCTVTQVEEVKALARMMPIWATTIMLNVCLAQLQTFSIEQGATTDRYIGKNHFQIPAASLIAFPVILLMIVSPLYELVFVPIARKITGLPTGITYLQRIGAGLFMAIVSMTIAGLVERRRTRVAREHGLLDSLEVLQGVVPIPMSVFWLVFQFLAFGFADMFTYVGVLEFFYHEAPEGMRSLGTGISQSTLAIGYFLSSSIVNLVKRVSSHHGGDGNWLPDNINRSHLDYFYWMLAIVNLVNLFLFIVCAKLYKYRPRSHHVSKAPHHVSTAPNDKSNIEKSVDNLLRPATPPTPTPPC